MMLEGQQSLGPQAHFMLTDAQAWPNVHKVSLVLQRQSCHTEKYLERLRVTNYGHRVRRGELVGQQMDK